MSYSKWLSKYRREQEETKGEHIIHHPQRQEVRESGREVETKRVGAKLSRRSSLTPMWVPSQRPQREVNSRCVGCQAPVTPGMCYTGSVIAGMTFRTIEGTETTPVTGVIECLVPPVSTHLIGGEEVKTSKRVAFHKRNKGFLCDTCASNYHTLEDKHGVKHPIVQIDVRPGFIGSLAIPVVERRSDEVLSNKFVVSRSSRGF